MAQVKIATFNVNSVRSRLHILEKWLPSSEVDVLCLQETKTVDEHFPVEFFEKLGYKAAFRGQKGYNGVAILSRFPMEEIVYGFGDGKEPNADTRIIQAKISSLRILNTYVPQGKSIDHEDYIYKQEFLKRIGEIVGNYPGKDEVLWVGDLNVAPTELDVTRPETKKNHVCFHDDVKSVFSKVIDTKFVDIFRKYRPGEGEFSFWDYRVKNALERNIGWRIDHVLATRELWEHSVDCYVDREPRGWEKPSDHAPVVSVFDIMDI